jgi:SAM-dependent methyltransferase
VSGREEGRYWDRFYAGLSLDVLRESSSSDSVHPVYNPGGAYSVKDRLFLSWVVSAQASSALVVGAGIDKIGILLARRGCRTTSLDLSAKAGELTGRLAREQGVGELIRCVCGDWEEADLGETFELIVFRDCLHHMRLDPALARIDRHRAKGGTVLGLEPICPLPMVRRLHARVPFHPFPFLSSERELDLDDLRRIETALGAADFRFFDFLTRESLSVLMYRIGLRHTIARLGTLDQWLIAHLPVLERLASYVVFRSTRA